MHSSLPKQVFSCLPRPLWRQLTSSTQHVNWKSVPYKTLNRSHVPKAAAFMSDIFVNGEPMSKYLKLQSHHFNSWMHPSLEEMVKDEMCFFIEDPATEEIDCCVISKRFDPTGAPPSFEGSKPLETIFAAVDNKIPEYINRDNTLYMFMLGTHKRALNRGLGYALQMRTFDSAYKKGYKYVLSELTAPQTQHMAFNKFGFKNLNEVEYKDFDDFKGLEGKCCLGLLDLEDFFANHPAAK